MIAGILLFAGVFFGWTYTFPATAALLPRLISFAMICLTLLHIITQWVKVKKAKGFRQKEEKDRRERSEEKPDRTRGMNWQVSSLLMIGFMVLIFLIGFGPATFVSSLTVPYLLGYRNYKVVVPFAAGMSAIIALGFGKVLMIPLPVGLLWELISK